jgi:hypothetical protein
MTTPPVPEGRCTDCTTAKPPAGAPTCQACRMLRILDRPMTPETITDDTEAAA